MTDEISKSKPYYGWVILGCAVFAMVATFPGRTFALGLINDPLSRDFKLSRETYSQFNMLSILIGAMFCIPLGALIDRYGLRVVFILTTVALGGSTIAMSETESPTILVATLILLRGFGESGLSVLSMSMVGKWFSRRVNMAMGIFAALVAVGFVAAIVGFTAAEKSIGWRDSWKNTGIIVLLGGAVVGLALVRSRPRDVSGYAEEFAVPATRSGGPDFKYLEALRTPAFWCIALGAPLYALAFNAISFFNQEILALQGFGETKSKGNELLGYVFITGLLCNFLGGWLGTKIASTKLLGGTLLTLAGAFAAFPAVRTDGMLAIYAAVVGGAGGVVTVVFFSAWPQLFGRANLGRIQGTAQVCSVLASAVGPWLLEQCRLSRGNYDLFFHGVGAAAALFGIACCVVPQPKLRTVSAAAVAG